LFEERIQKEVLDAFVAANAMREECNSIGSNNNQHASNVGGKEGIVRENDNGEMGILLVSIPMHWRTQFRVCMEEQSAQNWLPHYCC
jgi:hypothetical protein